VLVKTGALSPSNVKKNRIFVTPRYTRLGITLVVGIVSLAIFSSVFIAPCVLSTRYHIYLLDYLHRFVMAMKKDLHTLGLLACAAKIAAGTLYYFFVDFVKQTCVEEPTDQTGKKCAPGYSRFNRPFFAATVLFFGMTFTLLPYFFLRHNKPGVTKIDKMTFINMIVPSVLEFVGQTMFLLGAMKIPMSLSLTLKGARVVFSALLLVIFLKRKLFAFHWVSIVLTLVGIVVSSLKEMISPSENKDLPTTEVLIGISLVLAGEFIRSMRTVLEEKLMKKLKYDALLVVGLQGAYALVLSIPALFVVDAIQLGNGKSLENLSQTMTQFFSSPIVLGISFTTPITVPGLFVAGAYVTKLMSAVHNALTTIITNGIVWMLAVIVYYIDNKRGEELIGLSSVQLVGFIVVLVSSLMYDAIIRIPQIFYYPLDRAAASGAGSSEKSVLGIVESEPETMASEETKQNLITP
jgi:hypothetical protein